MKRFSWFFTSLIVVVIGAILFASTITYTSTPRFCSSCHIMETRYISWRNSDHVDFTNCLSCHAEPGVLGEAKAHLAGSRYVYSFLRGEVSRPILLAEVPNENCFKCHEKAQLKEKPGAGEIHDTYHKIHIAKELHCVDCHGGLAHATMLPVKARSAMTLCEKCHKPGTAPFVKCALCHPAGPSGPAFFKPQMAASRQVERSKVLKQSVDARP